MPEEAHRTVNSLNRQTPQASSDVVAAESPTSAPNQKTTDNGSVSPKTCMPRGFRGQCIPWVNECQSL